MPARGNEKPHAETRVRVLQRQWATPVPAVADLDALERAPAAALPRRGGAAPWPATQESIGVRFARDRAGALPLPAHAVRSVRIQQPAQVDKYQTVQLRQQPLQRAAWPAPIRR